MVSMGSRKGQIPQEVRVYEALSRVSKYTTYLNRRQENTIFESDLSDFLPNTYDKRNMGKEIIRIKILS